MLLLSEKLKNVPIMSLQTGTELAQTTDVIIDPRTLSIYAFYVNGQQIDHQPSVLHAEDIREAGELGFIIDDSSKIMELDGLVRLQEIIDYGFVIFSSVVVDRSGKKLGKVTDFSFDPMSFTIQQIYIQQPLLRSFSSASNIVHRSQIISVSKAKIVVDTPTIQDPAINETETGSTFVNPFRAQSPQLDQTDKN